ncbi:MAG: hypothetical protein ACFE0Q_20700 [Anaerolineae bacterium]
MNDKFWWLEQIPSIDKNHLYECLIDAIEVLEQHVEFELGDEDSLNYMLELRDAIETPATEKPLSEPSSDEGES